MEVPSTATLSFEANLQVTDAACAFTDARLSSLDLCVWICSDLGTFDWIGTILFNEYVLIFLVWIHTFRILSVVLFLNRIGLCLMQVWWLWEKQINFHHPFQRLDVNLAQNTSGTWLVVLVVDRPFGVKSYNLLICCSWSHVIIFHKTVKTSDRLNQGISKELNESSVFLTTFKWTLRFTPSHFETTIHGIMKVAGFLTIRCAQGLCATNFTWL